MAHNGFSSHAHRFQSLGSQVRRHAGAAANGRIHRFLINDTLLRDQAIPAGVILPVSATITSVREFGHGYDRVLEVFSRPFMRRYDAAYHFGEMVEYEDGVKSNFAFDAYDDANAAWRYPDLTEHAIYDADAVRMIRSIKENGWRVSSKLVKEYPILDDKARALRVVEAVQSAFEDREPLPIVE